MADLYRHFDKDGVLLYIGRSLSALNRLISHRSGARWYRDIAHVRIEKIPADQIKAAEKLAIETEQPLFNIQYSLEKKEARRAAASGRSKIVPQNVTQRKQQERAARVEAAFWKWRAERQAKQNQGNTVL